MAVKSLHGLRTEVGHKKEKMQAMFKPTKGAFGHSSGGGEKRGGSRKQIRVAPGSRVPV